MKRALLLLLVLTGLGAPGRCTPVFCSVNAGPNCTLTGVGAGWTYFIQVSYGAAGVVVPTDTFGLTMTTIRSDTFGDSFGTQHLVAYYTHTGANSGNDTVVFNGGSNVFAAIAEAWPPTDVRATGSPVDNTCGLVSGPGTVIPVGNNNVDTCSVTSHAANDIYQYFVYTSASASCFFTTTLSVNNGPTVNKYLSGINACNTYLVNVIQPESNNTILASGAPATTLVNVAVTNTSGGNGFLAAQHVLLFGGTGSAKRKLPPYYIKFKPRRVWRTVRAITEDL